MEDWDNQMCSLFNKVVVIIIIIIILKSMHKYRSSGLDKSVQDLKSQSRPTSKVFVYKIEVNPIHTVLKYGDYYDIMDR